MVVESWQEITRRPARAVVSGLGIALGAAAVVATLTLVETIQFQVGDEFDATRATQVEMRQARGEDGQPTESAAPFPPRGTVDRIGDLSGVEGVATVRESFADHRIALNQLTDPTSVPEAVPVYSLNVEAFDALGLRVRGPGWHRWHEEQGERVVVLSEQVAEALGASDARPGDRVFLDGAAFTVAGVLERAERLPALRGAVAVPVTISEPFTPDRDRDRIIAVTAPGAAQEVAAAMPVAMAPEAPDAWTAYAPADDDTLRRAVDRQLEVLALGLGGVVALLGMVSIGNVTLSSVLQRIGEIGLRRAVGARPRHIAAHIVFDAAALGALGGALGALLGLTAALGVTAWLGWNPVVDMRIPLVAVVGAVIAGGLAGLYPARVGSRLQPTEALRRE